MRFAIFPVHLLKVLRLPRKSDAKSYEVLHLSRKITSANLKIWCSKMQPLSGNQRPDLLTSLMNMSFVLRLPREIHLWRLSHRFWKCYKPRTFCSILTRCTIPCACHAKAHLNVQKCSLPVSFLHFWLQNVLRATTACTFSTSQLPKVVQTWFCTFWLQNVLRATTACTFSTSQLPKVVQTWCALCILTLKFASRHNCVLFFNISTSKSGPNLVYFVHFDLQIHNSMHLFISHLARWLRTRRFSEPTFQPSGASNHWKNTEFRDFPTFSRICIFFLLTLSLLWSALFYSSLLSDSAHLCFSSVHIVGSLTSKLPSIICINLHIYIWITISPWISH